MTVGSTTTPATTEAIATFSVVALDCPDPRRLAEFYSALTGWPISTAPTDADWLELVSPDDVPTIAFQLVVDGYTPPEWPSTERSQQLHLDFDVPDLDEGERQVLAIGATKPDHQPGESFRVYLDPAGHPFCLVKA